MIYCRNTMVFLFFFKNIINCILTERSVELKKYEDSRTDQHKLIRDADTPANLGIRRIVDRLPFSGKKKQRKVAVKKLDGITENIKLGEEAKSIGNGCMVQLAFLSSALIPSTLTFTRMICERFIKKPNLRPVQSTP